jgi:hypothetical protein
MTLSWNLYNHIILTRTRVCVCVCVCDLAEYLARLELLDRAHLSLVRTAHRFRLSALVFT